ncbi:MAG: ATP-binding protein [Clostridia bacterium]|nr:ATP-binding protein [Clostridia bacterium]
MTKRILWSMFSIALLAAALMAALVVAVQYKAFENRIVTELNTETSYIAAMLPEDNAARADVLASLSSRNRITLIDPSGTVLYDNTQPASNMESHVQRPEFLAAQTQGAGLSVRYSDTSLEKLIYCARRLEDGTVLRIAATQKSALGILSGSIFPILLLLALLAILSILLSKATAKRIVSPINALNLDQPLENDAYDELSPLLMRMERQQRELNSQLDAYRRKQTELTAITENMREGMILLNSKGVVLSMNASAAAIFHVSAADKIDGDVWAVTRNVTLQQAISAVLEGKNAEVEYEEAERHYQFMANPVLQNGKAVGAVLLLLDTTDQYAAQLSRREFTANVSHELKTPLTSISGYAEIMRDGVAKPEDTQRFAGRIYDEANRLIALVNDILELSRLDERKLLEKPQEVDLLAVTQEAIGSLSPAAEAKHVRVDLQGEPVTIKGYPKLLFEIAYNLIDNAIKYNVPEGSVRVSIQSEGGQATLCVADTGIGVPEEHAPRIFERFYRVDKSRSKESGGTGLGLSIVKHGAAIHNAKIEFASQVGQGTTIRVVFPHN